MRCSTLCAVTLFALTWFRVGGEAFGQDKQVFSGPQVGEKVVTFSIRGVYDDQAGKEFDYLRQAAGKPTLLIFVHELTRPSIAVTRMVMDFAARHRDKIYSSVVFLGDDSTALENQLKRARHAMPRDTMIGISPDGQEGPGAYGLNRKVTLTVILAKDQKVTANFALVQPSVQADVPKILAQLVKIVGGKVPALAELQRGGSMRTARREAGAAPDMRSLLGPVIRKNATDEQVDQAAKRAEQVFAKNRAARRQAGIIARRIIDAGKLDNYGTKRAREYLRKWAREYKDDGTKPAKRRPKKQ